jgi:hypothetical protein
MEHQVPSRFVVAAFISCFCLNLIVDRLQAGVLRVHPGNPCYFADGSGRAIYLGGHQIFVDLQDNSFNKAFIRGGDRTLHWQAYLDFARQCNFNYLRNWIIWSTGSGSMGPVNKAVAFPMPYKRVRGHGRAKDGGYKFDVHQFDETFFGRMRQRCEDLQRRGIYVSIMLFEVYGFLRGEACGQPVQTLWDGNIFNKANNINGVHMDYDGDGKGMEFFYTQDGEVLRLQKAYVKKVIDTVNHLDNILYEVANELHSPQWQYQMVEFIKRYEKSKPKQHLVLLSAGGRTRGGKWVQMNKPQVVDSAANCFAVAGSWASGQYRKQDPPANKTAKPGFVDMDHVAPGSHDVGYVWTAFTRGYHFNLYDKPFESPDAEAPAWECVRYNVGKTVEYAHTIDLVNAQPRPDLASTGFCLAKPGWEYIVYQPNRSSFTVSGLQSSGSYYYQWYDAGRHESVGTGCVETCGSTKSFTPANESMVLYLKRAEEDN